MGGTDVQGVNEESRLKRLGNYLRPGRGVVFIILIHLVAFHVLFLSLIHLVEREVAYAHAAEVRDTVVRLLGTLHPVLAGGERDRILKAVDEAKAREQLLALEFRGAVGSGPTESEDRWPLIASHESGDRGILNLEAELIGDKWVLSGVVPIVASPHCGACHVVGTVLSQCAVTMDISDNVAVAGSRLRRNAGIFVVFWVVGLATLNISARRIAKRRFRTIQKEFQSVGGAGSVQLERVLPPTLDRVSAEMYESLITALKQVCDREERVTARIHHTERLASLGQIAAGLAHEIKNPLAGIRGALELLRDDESESGGGRRELYEQMIGEMDRVHGILHSLLRFARPSPLHRVPADVNILVRECVDLMAHGLRRKGIILEAEVADGIGSHPLDVAQIRQVLVNLINNAGEAIGKDGRITVRASAFPQDRGLILSVEDDGPGMSEDEMSKIFQPFFTTKFSGTGLGLAVSRTIVLGHGGTLEVTSSPGEGSTFFILLPEIGENQLAVESGTGQESSEPSTG